MVSLENCWGRSLLKRPKSKYTCFTFDLKLSFCKLNSSENEETNDPNIKVNQFTKKKKEKETSCRQVCFCFVFQFFPFYWQATCCYMQLYHEHLSSQAKTTKKKKSPVPFLWFQQSRWIIHLR